VRYTRRRWDFLILFCALVLLVAGTALGVCETGRVTPKVLLALVPAAALYFLRFQIPREGWEMQPIGRLPRERRQLILWCVSWMGIMLCAAPFAGRTRNYWWIWALASGLLMAATLVLARRADRAGRAEGRSVE
jgi:hypothetical protein